MNNYLQKELLFLLAALFPACHTPQPPIIQPEYSAHYTAPAAPGLTHINTPWMKTGESYPLAEACARLRVENSADGEEKHLMLHRGDSWPARLGTSIRHFGYAWSPLAPEYLIVFNNYASKENSARIYRLLPETEELYYKIENATDERCTWSVKTWTRSSIVLEGVLASSLPGDKATLYCHIPLQH